MCNKCNKKLWIVLIYGIRYLFFLFRALKQRTEITLHKISLRERNVSRVISRETFKNFLWEKASGVFPLYSIRSLGGITINDPKKR